MNKFRSTGFWLSFGGAVVLFLQTICELFGFSFNSQVVSSLISSVCGVLVVVGVLIPEKFDELKIDLPGLNLDDKNFNENTETDNIKNVETNEINNSQNETK